MVLDLKLRDRAEQVAKATTAAEVVGPDDTGRKQRVRKLRAFFHPDCWGNPDDMELAEQAFAALELLLAKEAKASSGAFDITSRKRTYQVSGLAFRGTVANLYACRYLREPGDPELKQGLLKLPRSVRDNDLVQAEAATTKKIWATGRRRTAYFPRFEDAFKYRDKATAVDRQALVMRRLDGFISLRDVLDEYPHGIDVRDLAWIWRRGLAAISLLHELDIVHGSLLPEHVLIHPFEHGLQLCGMVTAVPAGTTVKLKVSGHTNFYAPEILKKEEATTATDLYMFHRTMLRMLAHDAPRQFFSFIDGVCFDRPSVRPQDPKYLLGEFDDLLFRIYPRKFRHFPPGRWGTP